MANVKDWNDFVNSITKPVRMGSLGDKASKLEDDAKKDAQEFKENNWIWVDGYKGTDRNMMCRDYQFELGRQYDMPEGAAIEKCESGFHLCVNLKNVYNYYEIGRNNRFFKVKALVRQSDYEKATVGSKEKSMGFNFTHVDDKLAAKSIIFERELTNDEIFNATALPTEAKGWDEFDFDLAREIGIRGVIDQHRTQELIALGYNEELAKYIVDDSTDLYKRAVALAHQLDISMDTRILAIFSKGD